MRLIGFTVSLNVALYMLSSEHRLSPSREACGGDLAHLIFPARRVLLQCGNKSFDILNFRQATRHSQ